MSQYWAGCHGIAMVLNQKEFDNFLTTYCEKQNMNKEEMDEQIDYDGLSEIRFIASNPSAAKFDITEINVDRCDGMILYPMMLSDHTINKTIYDQNGKIEQPIMFKELRSENCYAIFADKDITSGTIFLGPKYRYDTYEELLTEFKNKMERYLPDDFDWNGHIGDFSYAAYA